MSQDKEESKREMIESLIDTFLETYSPATLASCDRELTIYDIRMFFNMFYVSDPRMDVLDECMERLSYHGFHAVMSYSGEPVICVKLKS